MFVKVRGCQRLVLGQQQLKTKAEVNDSEENTTHPKRGQRLGQDLEVWQLGILRKQRVPNWLQRLCLP